MSAPIVIGVDWGTTNLRAFRFDGAGNVVETRRAANGVGMIKDRAFEAALREIVGDWLTQEARIVISGMAGSREGWREAPYAPCPADLASVRAAMVRPDAALDARLAPGLSAARGDGLMEIMRGEETQIFGALDSQAADIVVAPGTHSKWARVAEGRVTDIRTYMTGEIYALLKQQSILTRLIDGDASDPDAFALGVQRSLRSAALLNLLFSVRSEGLFGHIATRSLSAYLSGLLIGAEITEGLAEHRLSADIRILVIAAAELGALYRAAFARAGFSKVEIVDGEAAAARGLWRLAQPWSDA
ncbi:MAG TPA: 2-dehydro-3-deoxygalactonokinase [Caulobacterales bacterium]|nr:2-dehydro-3-deoxygalactonokinase [Caulobacterales bacterium]